MESSVQVFLSTRRIPSGIYLAEKEKMTNICAPFETPEEIELFKELAPKFIRGQALDYHGFANAFNLKVKEVEPFSKSLRFKVAGHIEQFSKDIHKKVLSNQRIDTIRENLINTRRALKVNSSAITSHPPIAKLSCDHQSSPITCSNETATILLEVATTEQGIDEDGSLPPHETKITVDEWEEMEWEKLLDAIKKSGAKVTPSQIRTQIYELGFNQDKWNRSMIKTRLWRANNLPPTKK